MTLTFGFYNAVANDRVYDAIQMSQIMKGVINDGIFSQIGTSLRVTNGGGLIANVGIGKAWFNSTWTDNDAVYPITLDAADALNPRIDIIVLEIDQNPGVRANSLKFVKGTPASSPVAPSLITGALKNQYALAHILIPAGSTTLGTITDKVNAVGGTPYVTTGLEPSLPKATIAEIQAGVVADKYIDPLNLKSSINVPNATPGAVGNHMVSNGSNWISESPDGWIKDINTWSYLSVDGPTGIFSVNANLTGLLMNGMRLKYQQTMNLSCYMPFDANSNSGIGSFVTTDTAMTYTSGKISNAATFNGTTSLIAITDNAALKPTTNANFSLGFWMKTSVVTRCIFQSYSRNTNRAGIMVVTNSSGQLVLEISKNTGVTNNVDYRNFIGRTNVCDNAWHYVVVTQRANYLQLYVDGKLETSDYSFDPGYAATNYIRIGCQNFTGTDQAFFSGQIDDFYFINNYALSEETIMRLYLGAVAQGTSVLIDKTAIITNVGPFSGGNTLITAYHGTDSNLVNSSISNIYYSNIKAPNKFNINPNKWSIYAITLDISVVNTPTNTVYWSSSFTPPSLIVSCPIGIWDLSARMSVEIITTANAGLFGVRLGLDNANSGSSNPEWGLMQQVTNDTAAAKTFVFPMQMHIPNLQNFVKTNYYFVVWPTASGNMTSVKIAGSPFESAVMVFVLAYL